jgi:hypothetical protein
MTTIEGLGRGFDSTSVESYMRWAATHQGQICNEIVREEFRSRNLGLSEYLYLVSCVYIYIYIYICIVHL